MKGIWSMGEMECFQEQGLESDKWNEENLKWGEDQLNAVKGRKIRRGGMWSVYTYKGSGVDRVVWFTHFLVHLVVFNTDSSTLGSTRLIIIIK